MAFDIEKFLPFTFSNLRNKHCQEVSKWQQKFSISNDKHFFFITNGSILFAISSFAILIEEITSCADSGTKKKVLQEID